MLTSSPETRTAKGFIFKTNRTYYLDTDKSEVTIEGIIKNYDPNLVQVLLDDIYVDANLLSEWLDVQLSITSFYHSYGLRQKNPFPLKND